MPSLPPRSTTNKHLVVIIMLLMMTLCPTKQCHSLQIYLPSTRRWLSSTSRRFHSSGMQRGSSTGRFISTTPPLSLLSDNYSFLDRHYYRHRDGRCSWNNHLHKTAIKLYSNNSPTDDKHHESSSNNYNNGGNIASGNDILRKTASSFLKKHLSQLEYDGKLSTNEVKSITDALLEFNNDNSLFLIHNNGSNATDFCTILQSSIDLYMVQKESRLKWNIRPIIIANVGGYVRTIIRSQLDRYSNNNDSSNNNNNRIIDTVKQTQHQWQQEQLQNSSNSNEESIPTTTTTTTTNTALLQSFIQKGLIDKNELNASCLSTLHHASTEMVQYALEAYVRQKQRRIVKGMTPILDPSSYVLKILRNATSRDVTPKQNQQPLYERGGAPTSTTAAGTTTTTTTTTTTIQQFVSTPNDDKENISPIQIPLPAATTTTTTTKNNPRSITISQVDTTLHHLRRLNQPIRTMKGVGPKAEAAFHNLGIFTLRDLLWHFPRSYIDRSTLQSDIRNVPNGQIGTVRLTVVGVGGNDVVSKGNSITCVDESGNNVDVTFFYGTSHRGMLLGSNELKKICNYHFIIVSGKVQHSTRRSTFFKPDKVVPADRAGSVLGIEPVYALSSGLKKSVMVNVIHEALQVVKELIESMPESYLSDEALEVLSWPKLADALTITHQPKSMTETGPNSPARVRLAFDELCIQQAQIALMRWNLKYNNVHSIKRHQQRLPTSWNDSPLVASAVESLPFELTQSQKDCLAEMWRDAVGDTNSRMVRLLRGEVGSGKTVLAYLLALGCIEGRQGGGRVAAILAPTQLLALQHAASISGFVSALKERRDHSSSSIRNIHVEILTGAVTGKRREELFRRLQATNVDDAVILIGTHALVTPDIVARLKQLPSVSSSCSFGLALSVVDEEQRFGVLQREALSSCAANSLCMSATPIPRTFMMNRRGLMDYTQLVAEKNRAVKTTIASADDMDRVVSALQNKIKSGSKCFWVLPRIEDSDSDGLNSQNTSVETRYRALVDIFGENRVGFVHGRMEIEDREKALASFAEETSEIVILVGTTVIEVGIDIPNVNVLIVEQAERFGLSQLHQLRGRIGRKGSRDDLDCHCLLLTDVAKTVDRNDSAPMTRLEILRETMDGAAIAEADLMLRGAGDMLGFIQSGIKSGYAVDLAHHWEMLPAASLLATSFLQHFDRGIHTHYNESMGGSQKANDSLLKLHQEGKVKAFYDETNAASESGFALRVMLLLFGERNCDNLKESLNILATLNGQSQNDTLISKKILEIADFAGSINSPEINQVEKTTSISRKPVASQKPRMLTTTKNAVNFLDDVCFILLDVETTGLDAVSSHVIQLAGKELGSGPDDEFAEYILPPPTVKVPKKIEDLTGITDDFLRNGKFKVFNEVYHEFQDFCIQQANGRNVCFVAHNAKFDIGMIESELRRWRTVDKSAPVLADIFASSLDTISLFRERRLWTTSNVVKPRLEQPSSFKLGDIYYHVFNENMDNAHNAVGDVRALERLLLSNHFADWKIIGNKMQRPFIKVT